MYNMIVYNTNTNYILVYKCYFYIPFVLVLKTIIFKLWKYPIHVPMTYIFHSNDPSFSYEILNVFLATPHSTTCHLFSTLKTTKVYASRHAFSIQVLHSCIVSTISYIQTLCVCNYESRGTISEYMNGNMNRDRGEIAEAMTMSGCTRTLAVANTTISRN
jgi:hypothetical protein